MIDLVLLREQPEETIKKIKRKDPAFSAHELVVLDKRLREFKQEVESLRAEKNELARQGSKGMTEPIRARSLNVGQLLKDSERELGFLEEQFKTLYLRCPNIPFDDIPDGGKESNKIVKEFGEKPVFNFTLANHVELATRLGWVDFEAAARMSGSNFVLYKDGGVNLVYVLALFMYNHNLANGYSPVLPPSLINEKALEGASNFPRFKEEVYALEKDNLYLTPTSEVNLSNLYRDTILPEEKLPIRLTSWTSCFRREAGGYGATERGLIRVHQFEKLEIYTFCTPEQANQEQERMLTCAEEILQKLGLHYRITLLAAQDCSFASAKTYDIEVWMPGQKEYKEVSSVSNCTDFQSRRVMTRYSNVSGRKHLVNTLNASSLALPRLIVALLETYQQKDGTVELPEVLRSVTLAFKNS